MATTLPAHTDQTGATTNGIAGGGPLDTTTPSDLAPSTTPGEGAEAAPVSGACTSALTLTHLQIMTLSPNATTAIPAQGNDPSPSDPGPAAHLGPSDERPKSTPINAELDGNIRQTRYEPPTSKKRKSNDKISSAQATKKQKLSGALATASDGNSIK